MIGRVTLLLSRSGLERLLDVGACLSALEQGFVTVVCLHHLGSGELLAVADSATVTAWRTGLAAALATHALARPGAATVAVIGAGAAEAARGADIVALATWSREPLLDAADVRPGTHLTSLAAAAPTRSPSTHRPAALAGPGAHLGGLSPRAGHRRRR
jgi:alanine dehydrogenase